MVGDELAIEQRITPDFEPRDQPSERNFGCVGLPAEHAFTKKHPAQCEAIKAADQFGARSAIVPHFDAVGEATDVEGTESPFDAVIDPRRWTVSDAFRTFFDHCPECGVGGHPKAV